MMTQKKFKVVTFLSIYNKCALKVSVKKSLLLSTILFQAI